MDKFLETYNFTKLNQEESENLNIPVTINETEAVIKKLPAHKSPRPNGLTGEFYHTFKEELRPILLKLLQKNQEDGGFPRLFYKARKKIINQYP